MATAMREIAPTPETEPRFRVVLVTPDLAREWLRRNTRNRPLSKGRVEEYAREMEAGRWMMNGEAISFDVAGNLIQGQHRLHACVKADTPFKTLVAEGLSPEVFSTLDQGGKRTLADLMALNGETNANILAAATVRLWKYERGALMKTGAGSRPSGQEGLETLERHPGLRESIPFGKAMGSLVSGSAMTFLHYVFAQKDPALADWFMRALATGEFIGASNPVYILRARLVANMSSKAKLPEKEILALVIKSWNATREGKRMRTLRWRNSGDKPEPFPEIL